MKPRVILSPGARRDFTAHYVWLAEHAGMAVACRFRKAVAETYRELAEMPAMGAPNKVRSSRYAGLRLWPVREFRNYLVAYYPRSGGISVERLFHAKQDYTRIFE